MYKEVLRSIEDVSLFPIIAILVFVIFFVLMLIYVIRMDKSSVETMASLPLKSSEVTSEISLNGKAKRS
ncbi:MAG: cbb3-type cytochrome c oxidase subunit 3 [Bacteroidia bacterium]|nr:cbb3-type cytochrome c oxidase subunit 3 [Bacteroidia bacterium]